MKKTMMILALVAFTALPVIAQTPAQPAQPEVRLPIQSEVLLQSLDLTNLGACNSTVEDLVMPSAVNTASCPDAARAYYYSDATYTTQVGTCWHACCELWSCTGEITPYYTVHTRPCDFN